MQVFQSTRDLEDVHQWTIAGRLLKQVFDTKNRLITKQQIAIPFSIQCLGYNSVLPHNQCYLTPPY
jgi:hypothetical protein